MKVGIAGRFRITVHKKDGSLKSDTGWFDNLITNQGLDWWGVNPTGYTSGNFTSFCCVGTGNTTPAFTDTVLTAALTPAAHLGSSSSSYVAGPPAYWSNIYTYTWAQGAIVGNIAEIGIGDLANPNPPYTGVVALYSHALIVDGGGSPTTISVTSTDTLSCTYEARLYINITDTNYSISIGGTTYSGIYRPMDITHPSLSLQNFSLWLVAGYPSVFYYNGSIGAITATPSGTDIGGNPSQIGWSVGPYTVGSYTCQFTGNIAANSQGALNITAIGFTSLLGKWQFSVSPALVRAAYQNISTTWAISWGRYP